MKKTTDVPTEIPLVVLSAKEMILPTVLNHITIPNHPDLIVEAAAKQIPYLMLTMNIPGYSGLESAFYKMGVVTRVEGVVDGEPKLIIWGIHRAPILEVIISDSERSYNIAVAGEPLEDRSEPTFVKVDGVSIIKPGYVNKFDGFMRNIQHKIKSLLDICHGFNFAETELLEEIYENFETLDLRNRESLNQLIWHLVFSMPYMNSPLKQEFIEDNSLYRRMVKCVPMLKIVTEIIRTDKGIESIDKKMRQKPKDGKKRLSSTDLNSVKQDEDEFSTDNPDLKEKFQKYLEIKKSIKNEEEKKIFDESAKKDLNRLKNSEEAGASGPEVAMFYTHLDWILAWPWGNESPQKNDINEFERVFESEHYGLTKAKDKISRGLAVRINNPDGKGRVLCFVGPPGVGKTSVCKSIAKGLGREYVRISLGGVREEAEIRGHRVTFMGAMPGNIVKAFCKAKTKNPIFVLDEIDKIGADFKGDPSSALLEVLDYEQNNTFVDHYMDCPLDLSKALFICTANTINGILPALRDRMDIIYFSGYTEEAKVQIAKHFLVPKIMKEIGLAQSNIQLKWPDENPDEILLKLVRGYTKESGVRNIERLLFEIGSEIVRKDLKEPGFASTVVITDELLQQIHGRPRLMSKANPTDIGEVIGLVVDEVGQGDITFVQAVLSLKTGIMDKSISQTDESEDDQYKSVQRAITVAKNWLEIHYPQTIEKLTTHLINTQVSDTFVKIGGPSAGITVCTAVISRLTNRPLRPYLAMTGAIALTGRVRAVGGIKAKIIAATNAGVKILILPESNRKDFDEDVPKSAKDKLDEVNFVENMDQVIEKAFDKDQPAS